MASTLASQTTLNGELSRQEPENGPQELMAVLAEYLPAAQVDDVRRAYEFGARAHSGQRRMSGEPYIFHPVAVARVLAGLRLDRDTIVAAMLHDVIEDTPTAKEQIAEEFGEGVAVLVDGVSKLTQINAKSKAEAQAESFRKMMLAMVEDIRVILIKLADRLHNMRTLGVMRAEKRRRIARETLDIYAPIAHRLGMNGMLVELEDLSFAAMYPLRYRVLADSLRRARGNRNEIVGTIQTALSGALEREGLEAEVVGREKHLFSLYQKMRNKEVSFSEIFDVYAFRIVVDRVDSCYRTLGVVHNVYKPVPGRFKDYIAIPKTNGYQSLHTVLFGPHGVPIEVQIRTREMDYIAETGVAAHWKYKSGEEASSAPHARAREWLQNILEMQRRAGNSLEFLENVKVDLFPDEIYVFTPRGQILRLPRGATPVDFAYAVHTDVGNTCVAAKIDRRLVPLSTQLANGQTVEVITAASARPNPAWLNFIVSARGRANIRHYLKNLQAEEASALGRRLLDRSLGALSLNLDEVDTERMQAVLTELECTDEQDLLQKVGLGELMGPLVARRLAPAIDDGDEAGEREQAQSRRAPLAIRGTEGMVVTFARCCRPIPGDRILGYLSSGRGIVVHSELCRNLSGYRKQPEKWIDVQWEAQVDREFPVEIRMEVINERGALATLAAEISRMDANIEHVSADDRYGSTSSLSFVISVRDRRHLARIMRRLHAMRPVIRINRSRA